MNELTEKFIKLLSAKGYVVEVMNGVEMTYTLDDGSEITITSSTYKLNTLDSFFLTFPDPKKQILFIRELYEVPFIAGAYLDDDFNLTVPKEDIIYTKTLAISYGLQLLKGE